ncbi:MAG: formate--tetrahydrofolate ligase [Alphaproteobacteria bacterium]|nr:formate--tetrahydrofolate ligase [Alphaproteobacteria bacterium]
MASTIDLEIAQKTPLALIEAIAAKLGIPEGALFRYGHTKAKIDLNWLKNQPPRKNAKLILVTAISPTAAGEGKTTTTIGLGDALTRIGKKTVIALREPSLGPCFGIKGGATGGGYAQVGPMEDINLHFTGDFHAITAAHNLLAALLDNHMHWGNALGVDVRKINLRRAMDMNDRSLRQTIVGLGGNGVVHEDGFDITVASEVMAIFCLANDATDLKARLDKMVVAQKTKGGVVTAADLKATGAMAALLKDALNPNLVQSLEGTPALIHGGPFANIAHGCNSVIATKAALQLGDYVVTEAGFGADLGAEKFLNIKCRQAGLKPDAAVVVATIRALKLHGGVSKKDLGTENMDAVKRGLGNLQRHVENMKAFGLPVVVAINHFSSDTAAENKVIEDACAVMNVPVHLCKHWGEGGRGAASLAETVVKLAESGTSAFKSLYEDASSLSDKIKTIAQKIYRAKDVVIEEKTAKKLARFEKDGYGKLSVCIAKTQYSFSADPALMGAPVDFTFPIRDVRLSAGAGFVVALAGDIMTMPGLPREPAAEKIGVGADGKIFGLF